MKFSMPANLHVDKHFHYWCGFIVRMKNSVDHDQPGSDEAS